MAGEKTRFALWIEEDVLALVEAQYRAAQCRSKSEFIEKAIRFYCGYLAAEAADAFLPQLLGQTVEGQVNLMMDRLGSLLFKLAVELDICMHILAADTDLDEGRLEKLRGRCVNEVRKTNGRISFLDALRFQKEL